MSDTRLKQALDYVVELANYEWARSQVFPKTHPLFLSHGHAADVLIGVAEVLGSFMEGGHE